MRGGHVEGGPPRGAAQLSRWYGYGANVLAVADARVVEARDDVADDTAIGDRAAIPLERASGNYVVLDLGGRYAFYEHLKPHSLRVQRGARVHRGEVLAQLGNTGSSSAGPHLHFHVADSPAELAAEGLPYVLDRFELLGTFQFPDDAATTPAITPRPANLPAARRRELPPPNAVVRW
jgi:murein DD-endopeptidase